MILLIFSVIHNIQYIHFKLNLIGTKLKTFHSEHSYNMSIIYDFDTSVTSLSSNSLTVLRPVTNNW